MELVNVLKMKNNLIALHGRMGSGKDTVAKIIQVLTLFPQMPTENVVKEVVKNKEFANNVFEIRKFADKLKDIVCILIGCSRRDLEDRDFKEKPLGKEWRVIKAQEVPKDNFHKEKIFSTLGDFEKYKKENPNKDFEKIKIVETTVRLLLQLIGTECFRDIIHPNTWVNALFADYEEHSNWVISDMRFENEFEAVKEKGGLCITVKRGEIPEQEHSSERALDGDRDWDYIIDNNGSLEELVDKIREILRETL